MFIKAKSDHETVILDEKGEVFAVAASQEAKERIIKAINREDRLKDTLLEITSPIEEILHLL